LLADSNIDAEHLITAHHNLLYQGLGSGFDVVVQMVNNFDFDHALTTFKVLCSTAAVIDPDDR
jgi:hypothetical protein